MKMTLLILNPQEPWLMLAVGYFHGPRMFWIRTNEKNSSCGRQYVINSAEHRSSFRSWTSAVSRSLEVSLSFNNHPVTAARYITGKQTRPGATDETLVTLVLFHVSQVLFVFWLCRPPARLKALLIYHCIIYLLPATASIYLHARWPWV